MQYRAVFLDRDGTINEEMGYINHENRFRVFDFAAPAIRILNEADFKVVVLTNQSGVARGYFEEELVLRLHKKLKERVQKYGATIDAIYYCPHHPTEGNSPYRKDCNCRKPKTGMVEQAVKELKIDISRSYMVGDRYKDVLFAHKAGLKPIFVKTGYGLGEYTYQRKDWKIVPDYIARDLLDAAKYISSQAQTS